MSNELKLLFICSRNKWRSRTAEKLYEGFPGYAVRSAGTEPDARIKVTEGHVGWADVIFVMEKRHAERLRAKFPEAIAGKKIICLHIPDDYEFMDPALIEVLKLKLRAHVAVPE